MVKPRGMVRGYSGYYKGIYLRSSLEFAYAYYLDYKGYNWKYEQETFALKDFYYKPDFFIYDDEGKLVEIVEIKGEGNSSIGIKKIQEFKDKFEVAICMLSYKDIVKLYQQEMPIRYNKAKTMWIEDFNAKLEEQWQNGKNNPMYGLEQRESTKRLISQKAKESFAIRHVQEKLRIKLQHTQISLNMQISWKI